MARLMSVKPVESLLLVRTRPTPLVSEAPHHQQKSFHPDNEIDCFGFPYPGRKPQDILQSLRMNG
jgi:hypothetical protein